jgi:hypothetical protein
MSIKLHHFAYNIKPNTLETVMELFELLGCTLAYREGEKRWCMIEQKPIPVDIQIIETKDEEIPLEIKTSTHIAFLSDSPKEDIDRIEEWAKEKKVTFKRGGWSDKELWFDLPGIFTNFVIEIMDNSIIEDAQSK